MSENIRRKKSSCILEHADIFKCPIWSSQMQIVKLKSLECNKHHCFDLSKQGYVNLLTRMIKTKYDKRMFNSRRLICQSGSFEQMTEKISEKIINEIRAKGEQIKTLDAGCGEGSHLSNIRNKLMTNLENDFLGVGMDLSKEGIKIASKVDSDRFGARRYRKLSIC